MALGSLILVTLFIIGSVSLISKFSYDRAVGDDDLRRVFRWLKDRQMLSNLDKCPVVHMGKSNRGELRLLSITLALCLYSFY